MAAINNPAKWGELAKEAERKAGLQPDQRICAGCGGKGTHYSPCDGVPMWSRDDGEALQRIQTEEEINLARRRALAAQGIQIVGGL